MRDRRRLRRRVLRSESTTLRRQVEQAARNLRADCAPDQAQRLDDAVR